MFTAYRKGIFNSIKKKNEVVKEVIKEAIPKVEVKKPIQKIVEPTKKVIEKVVQKEVSTSNKTSPTVKVKQKEKKPETKEEEATKTTNVDVLGTLKNHVSSAKIPQPQGGIVEPYVWNYDVQKIADNQYQINLLVKLKEKWAIYSQFLDSEDGPVATSILLENGNVSKKEKATENGIIKKSGLDPVFDMEVTKFKEGAVFSQVVTVTDVNKAIKGEIEFMVCDDAQCLPPTGVPFSFNFGTQEYSIGDKPAQNTPSQTNNGEIKYGGLFPGELNNIAIGAPDGSCNEAILSTSNLSKLFLLGFLGGLVALLTPCVFPMIPLTVSFFTKGSESKAKGISNAILYGTFIAGVYLLFSIPFHLLGSVDPNIFNDISTSVSLNVVFFIIFIVFAISFFGYFEIGLPSSWQNKSASAESAGGIIGIFFMALTLALVSFSCTGPILGSLLAGALTAEGGAWQLTAGMGGFGLALALPFALFAAFPGMMSALPKSGGWMTTVKVVLGFIELALALKFLSNADLVKHWGLLKVEVFLGLWIIIGIGLGLYLLGKIRFPHDSKNAKIGPVRIVLGVLSFAFVAYLATGLMVDKEKDSLNSLTLLSGIAPPACYSIFHPCDCPQQLDCYKDLETGIEVARKLNKPILLDFTGHACVNCRKMEENVWPQQNVYPYLKDDYILISLYVDEKIDIPENQRTTVTSRIDGRSVTFKRTGQKWAFMQAEYFGVNAQPFYVLMSPDGNLLNEPIAYTPDADEYAAFLKCGVDNFKKMNGK